MNEHMPVFYTSYGTGNIILLLAESKNSNQKEISLVLSLFVGFWSNFCAPLRCLNSCNRSSLMTFQAPLRKYRR